MTADADLLARLSSAVPAHVLGVCRTVTEAGYEAVIVGGCVRDVILGRTPQDWDVATSAHPDEMLKLFKHTIATGLQHGTVTVVTGKGKETHVEVTTYRGEGAYSDARRPDEVRFGVPLREDLQRRDLTVNAIAYEPVGKRIIDPFNGLADLHARKLHAVGSAVDRFTEDGLRVMRAVRFAAQLEFDLGPETEAGIPPALTSLAKVSRERVSDELRKLLATREPSRGLAPAVRTGIIASILPELAASLGLPPPVRPPDSASGQGSGADGISSSGSKNQSDSNFAGGSKKIAEAPSDSISPGGTVEIQSDAIIAEIQSDRISPGGTSEIQSDSISPGGTVEIQSDAIIAEIQADRIAPGGTVEIQSDSIISAAAIQPNRVSPGGTVEIQSDSIVSSVESDSIAPGSGSPVGGAVDRWLARIGRAPSAVRLAAMMAPIADSRRTHDLLKALKFSNEEAELASALVGVVEEEPPLGIGEEPPNYSHASVRRLLARLHRARRPHAIDLWAAWPRPELAAIAREVLHDPMDIGDLVVKGAELMKALDRKPGPEIGRILQVLRERVLDDPAINTREKLLAEAQKCELELGYE